MKSRSWYRVALATTAGEPQLVLASGEHVGQAVAEAAKELAGSWAIAVDLATTEEIPLGESVGKGHVVRLGDAPAGLDRFKFPTGALPAVTGGVTGMREGWLERRDPHLFVVEAQVEADHIVDLYLGLIERLPSADNLEIRLLEHFDAGLATDVWLTSRVNGRKIIRFIDDHDEELFGNGHVELGVYARAQKATLRLTQHKTVAWIGEERTLATELAEWLKELKVPQVTELPAVDDGAHHHFRTANGRDRKKLADELYKHRLRKVDSIKRVDA
ncbi:MAG: hypothetical protein ABJE66_25240 [Deltaproteobacteria bacterium]